ncbi:MAG: hypothetical protein AAFN79_16270 [Pseudomonadota bacterium]
MRITRLRAMVACVLAAAVTIGCAPKREARGPTPFDKTAVADCYTVELFTVAEIEAPSTTVPAAWNGYLGKWGKAGWDGKWCHDLHVLSVDADGNAVVMELHAPYEPWGRQATAFRRAGKIGEDGRLRVSYSGVLIEYWIQNGKLYGLRKEGGGALRIALSPGTNSGLGS